MNLIQREIEKLYENIAKYDAELAKQIAYGLPITSAPTSTEMQEWVEFISTELEKYFDETTIKNIRMGCYCNENGKLDEAKQFLKIIYNNSASLEEFVDKMNEYSAGWYLEDGALYTRYDDCPCPMLEGVERLHTKTWCYCTIGYNKKIFEYVFGCPIDVELIESIKLGSDKCLIKITINKKEIKKGIKEETKEEIKKELSIETDR